MAGFEDVLEGEVEALRHDIATNPDPRTLKLRALEAALAVYKGAHRHQAEDVSQGATRVERKAPKASADPAREKLFEEVTNYLSKKTEPTKTADIFTYLDMFDIHIGGNEPKSNLSAILHNSKRYKSYGRQGWMLPENAAAYDQRHSPPQRLIPDEEDGSL